MTAFRGQILRSPLKVVAQDDHNADVKGYTAQRGKGIALWTDRFIPAHLHLHLYLYLHMHMLKNKCKYRLHKFLVTLELARNETATTRCSGFVFLVKEVRDSEKNNDLNVSTV